MSMNDDIRKYPCFMVYNGLVVPALWLENTENYNHYCYDLHHFIRQSVRKNSPDFYKRVEHLQRLILMPKQMNIDLEELGAEDWLIRIIWYSTAKDGVRACTKHRRKIMNCYKRAYKWQKYTGIGLHQVSIVINVDADVADVI